MDGESILEVKIGSVYRSPSGILFRVTDKPRHGQDCSWPMVVYKNLQPTKDYPPGTSFVESESLFIKQFVTASLPQRIIFLDFDGVFTLTWDQIVLKEYVCRRSVKLLDAAAQELNALFVISSSWRIAENGVSMGAYLDLAGFTTNMYCADWRTKSLSGFRGDEVREWLSRHPEIVEYAIIDDETDFHPDQRDRLIHTDRFEGFGTRDYGRLLSIFGFDVKHSDLLRPFKSRGVGRDLNTYYEDYKIEDETA